MELSLRPDDGPVLHVDANGRINLAVLAEQQEALAELLQEGGYNQAVLFDMAGVEQVDSAGMSWLVVQHKRFCDAGGRFVVHSVPFTIMETLKVMRLNQVLNVAESETEALQLVQGASE